MVLKTDTFESIIKFSLQLPHEPKNQRYAQFSEQSLGLQFSVF